MSLSHLNENLFSLITVRPVVQFNPPAVLYIPGSVNLHCSVSQAVPNFLLTLKVGADEVEGPVYGRNMFSTVFTGEVRKEIAFTSRDIQESTLKCSVVWLKDEHNETLTTTRTVYFYCE